MEGIQRFLSDAAYQAISAADAPSASNPFLTASAASAKVDGPASATDNAIARFDGATGKLVQNSGAYIDDSGNVGIGVTNPTAKLDISSGNTALNIGADFNSITRTNNTNKIGRITSMHYANAEEPLALILGFSEASRSKVNIGGGISGANAATEVVIWTAKNTTTTTGAERMRIASDGNVGINTNNPTEKLHVIGNIRSSAEVHAGTKVVIASKVEQVYDSVNQSLKFNFL